MEATVPTRRTAVEADRAFFVGVSLLVPVVDGGPLTRNVAVQATAAERANKRNSKDNRFRRST